MKMNPCILLILVILMVSCQSKNPQNLPLHTVSQAVPSDSSLYDRLGIPAGEYESETDVVRRNENFADLLQRRGMDYSLIHAMTQKAEGVFDMRKLRVGNNYTLLFKAQDELPAYMIYEESVRTHVCFSFQDSLWVSRYQIPIQVEERMVEVTIEHSLWQDLEAAGFNPLVAIPLSEVYAWTIDFFGLQKGDSFKAYYLAYTLGDKELEPGQILAASFTQEGKTYLAFRYMQDSLYGYWNEEGENLQKAFLKAPLRYSRISSGFSYSRRHPITRVVRPHTGVDYAAPTGTPVSSIGDGVVISKGYAGGGGNTVKIKHNSVYTTAYMHLSKYASGIAVGKRVSQGQIIGYVGSTGSSTGPHLDFRVWQNGKPINPLKMESPPAKPVAEANMADFERSIASFKRLLVKNYYRDLADSLIRPLGLTIVAPEP